MKRATLKLDSMRKYQEFLVSPTSDNRFMIQSDKSIGIFDIKTGIGKLNTKGCYFVHLDWGSKPYTLTPEQLSECLKACSSLGGTTSLAGGSVIAMNTVTVIP